MIIINIIITWTFHKLQQYEVVSGPHEILSLDSHCNPSAGWGGKSFLVTFLIIICHLSRSCRLLCLTAQWIKLRSHFLFVSLVWGKSRGLTRILRVFSAHSPRILRAFSARAFCAENTRRMRGEYAENARRIRVSATRTFRVFSAHSPRNFRALKNLKKDPFFWFFKIS